MLRCLGILLVILAAGSSAAGASPRLETGIADDRLMLSGGAGVPAVAGLFAALGIDSVRLHARWIAVAPRPNDRRRPADFDPSDPDDPGYNWAALDLAIRSLRVVGIEPVLTITGSGPVWSSRAPERDNPRYKPDPQQFAQFAGAVARRYGKAVDRYLIWNEPNVPGWLEPQYACRDGRCIAVAPHLYRDLFAAAAPAVLAADPGAQLLLGSLAPRGGEPRSANTQTRPLAFLRALACVQADGRRDREGPCRRPRRVRADAFAYHPHPIARSPTEPAPHPDDAAIADLPRLEAALDVASAAGVVRPRRGRRFMIHLSEFGYQTRPPDPLGVSLAQQARWVQQATFLAWRDPRIASITQYEFQDEPGERRATGLDGWQSGMVGLDGRVKPLLLAFPQPFWIDVRPGLSRFWGQVRPGGSNRVALQRREGPGWRTVRRLRTDRRGFWSTLRVVSDPARYRFTYTVTGPDGAVHTVASRSQLATPRR